MSQPEKDALRFHMHELRTFAHPISPRERTGKGRGKDRARDTWRLQWIHQRKILNINNIQGKNNMR